MAIFEVLYYVVIQKEEGIYCIFVFYFLQKREICTCLSKNVGLCIEFIVQIVINTQFENSFCSMSKCKWLCDASNAQCLLCQ